MEQPSQHPMERVRASRITTAEAASLIIEKSGETITTPFAGIDFHLTQDTDNWQTIYSEYTAGGDYEYHAESLELENHYLRQYKSTERPAAHHELDMGERASQTVSALQNIKHSFDHALSVETDNASSNVRFIRGFLDSYNADPDNTKVSVGPMAVNDVADAIDAYREYFSDHIEETGLAEVVEESRKQMIIAAKSRRAKDLFGRDIRRIVGFVEQTPVQVADPLTVVAERMTWESDNVQGYYSSGNRIAKLDYLSASSQLFYEEDGEVAAPIKQREVMGTVMHELIHAATSTRYKILSANRLSDENHRSEMQSSFLVPKFLVEGVTEKLAYSLNSISMLESEASHSMIENLRKEDASRTIERSEYEGRVRRYFGNPREILTRKDVADLKQNVSTAYREKRLLIDLFFSKIDWKSQDTSQREAEHLLVSAFLDTLDDDEEKTDNRKAFNSLVARAAHPGAMNKLDMLIKVTGETQVAKLLAIPETDLSNPESLPYLASKRDDEHFKTAALKGETAYRSSKERLEKLRDLGAPEFIVEKQVELVENYEKTIQFELPEYTAVRRGLKAYIKMKTTNINSVELTHEQRLWAAIFGEDAIDEETLKLNKLSEKEKADLEAYREWKESGHPRIRKSAARQGKSGQSL